MNNHLGKNFLSLVMCICMLATSAFVMPISANESSPTLTLSDAVVCAGESFTVYVTASDNPGISSFTLSIDYDTEAFSLTDVVVNPDLGGQSSYNKKVVWITSNDTTYNGTILTLSFTANDTASVNEYPISVSYAPGDICNYNEEDVDFTVIPGKITVGDSGSTEDPGTGGGEDEPVTGPAIKVAGVSAAPGDTVSVPVDFLNNPGISSYTLSVSYDETRLRLDSVVSDDGVGGQFAFVKKAVWFSSSDVTVSGTFLTLNFTVLEDAPEGDANVSVSYSPGDICNYNEEDVSFTVIPGSVSIKAADELPGDIDGDGKVNSKDANLMKQAVVGRISLDKTAFSAADLNGDTKLNAQDCVLLKAIILGKS